MGPLMLARVTTMPALVGPPATTFHCSGELFLVAHGSNLPT